VTINIEYEQQKMKKWKKEEIDFHVLEVNCKRGNFKRKKTERNEEDINKKKPTQDR
jgi:hypothetical protein